MAGASRHAVLLVENPALEGIRHAALSTHVREAGGMMAGGMTAGGQRRLMLCLMCFWRC